MEEFKKIAVLDNEIQARLLDSVLTERGIPHRLRSYHDSAYDGIFQAQKGWGSSRLPLSTRKKSWRFWEICLWRSKKRKNRNKIEMACFIAHLFCLTP